MGTTDHWEQQVSLRACGRFPARQLSFLSSHPSLSLRFSRRTFFYSPFPVSVFFFFLLSLWHRKLSPLVLPDGPARSAALPSVWDNRAAAVISHDVTFGQWYRHFSLPLVGKFGLLSEGGKRLLWPQEGEKCGSTCIQARVLYGVTVSSTKQQASITTTKRRLSSTSIFSASLPRRLKFSFFLFNPPPALWFSPTIFFLRSGWRFDIELSQASSISTSDTRWQRAIMTKKPTWILEHLCVC